MAGELEEWKTEPRGSLAFVILCDQFSRNMYRDTPRAFAFDSLALETSRTALESGFQDDLADVEAYFLFMPFMHSEEPEDQRECVRLFRERRDSARPAVRGMLGRALEFAERHRDIVERFGRFPHRNKILGRQSTPEELEFLEQPNSSF